MPDTEKVNVQTEKTGLDRFLDAEDAEAERILGTPTTQTDATLDAAPEQASAPAEPAAPAPAPQEPPATPPVEAAPPSPEPAPESESDKEEKGSPWKKLREQDRELKALRSQLLELSEKKPDASAPEAAPEPEEVDPFAKTERELAALNQRMAQREQDDRIAREESAYRAQKPDYDAAIAHLVQREIAAWTPYAQRVAAPRLLADPNTRQAIRRHAIAAGKTEGEMAADVAVANIITQRRQALIDAAWAGGETVAEYAYRASGELYGYQPVSAAAATPAQTAQQRIAREKEKSEIAESVAGLSSTAGTAPPRAISSKADLSNFMKSDPAGYDRWQDEMDAKNPRWFEELP